MLKTVDECAKCKEDLREKDPKPFCPACGFPVVLVAGKYSLIRDFAEGGFGSVYLAEHKGLRDNQERIIKVLSPDMIKTDDMEKRFWREVQITGALSQRNDHIVRIYDDFGKDTYLGYFYVMEFLKGQTLNELLEDRKQLPPNLALHIFKQLCHAMGEAHQEEIVHRDLKPHNIILIKRYREDHFVKVIDFGIAKPLRSTIDPQLTQESASILGTPAYMAPEQWQQQPVGPHTDIYALGIILYELLTGTTPFYASSHELLPLLMAHLQETPELMTHRNPQLKIPEGLENAVQIALEKAPEDRYPDAEAFWAALEPFYNPNDPLGLEDAHFVPVNPEKASANQLLPSGDFRGNLPSKGGSGDFAYDMTADSGSQVVPRLQQHTPHPHSHQNTPPHLVIPGQQSIFKHPLFIVLTVACLAGVFTVVNLLIAKKSSTKTDAGALVKRAKVPTPRRDTRRPPPTPIPKRPGACTNGSKRPCYTGPQETKGKSHCKAGYQTCQNNRWGTCIDQILPKKELCNGKDDDCDGKVDENFRRKGRACGDCLTRGRYRCSKDKKRLYCAKRRVAGRVKFTISPPIGFKVRESNSYRPKKVKNSFCWDIGSRGKVLIVYGKGFSECKFRIRNTSRTIRLRMKRGGLFRSKTYCTR